jgi:uncharacterized membrane protein (UPF0127 family)
MFARRRPAVYYLFHGEKCLHSFFMRYPLYVIVADKQQRILDKFILPPWQISKYYRKAFYILETTNQQFWRKQRKYLRI